MNLMQLLLFKDGAAQEHREHDACNQEYEYARASEITNSLQALMGREKESDKARNGRQGTGHHVSSRRIHQPTKRYCIIGTPCRYKVNRGVNNNT